MPICANWLFARPQVKGLNMNINVNINIGKHSMTLLYACQSRHVPRLRHVVNPGELTQVYAMSNDAKQHATNAEYHCTVNTYLWLRQAIIPEQDYRLQPLRAYSTLESSLESSTEFNRNTTDRQT